MADIQLGAHTVRSHGTKVLRFHMNDWVILVLLVVIDIILNVIHPFRLFVGRNTMTDLRYSFKGNIILLWAIPITGILLSFAIFTGIYFKKKNVYDWHQAILDAIKDGVGRPRSDFFWRCFLDGIGVYDKVTQNVICHGKKSDIKEGHKSFPSGHTSWSFAGLGFLAWYLAGKIRVFDRKGHVAKLCIVYVPLLIASLVAVSRVDDYWHHWQDVFAGGILGLVVASFCYLQFFPAPYDDDGWGPHAYFQMLSDSQSNGQISSTTLSPLGLNSRALGTGALYVPSQHQGEYQMRDPSQILDAMESGGRR